MRDALSQGRWVDGYVARVMPWGVKRNRVFFWFGWSDVCNREHTGIV